MVHDLKCWMGPFDAIESGAKTHEIRSEADRKFTAGDVLLLRLWDPGEGMYVTVLDSHTSEPGLAKTLVRHVTYVTPGGNWGLPAGLCVMSIVPEAA